MWGGAPWEKGRDEKIETEFLQEVDDRAADALTAMLEGGGPLDPDDVQAWLTFMNSLLERHPTVLDVRDEQMRVVADQVFEEVDEINASANDVERQRWDARRHQYDLDALASGQIRQHMVAQIRRPDASQFFAGLCADVIRVANGGMYITSERPVVLNLGGEPGGEAVHVLSMALDPWHAFVAYEPWVSREVVDRLAQSLNRLLLANKPWAIYSSCPLVGWDALLRDHLAVRRLDLGRSRKSSGP